MGGRNYTRLPEPMIPGRGKTGDASGHPHQCQGTNKKTGEQCKKYAVPGRNFCKYHGGNARAGIASPQFKHGGFSKHVPNRMGEDYQVTVDDPELLNLRANIALTEARTKDLLRKVEQGDVGALYIKLKDLFETFKEARDTGDTGRMQSALDRIERVVDKGVADHYGWQQIQASQEVRRKLTESEQKRVLAGRQIITEDRMSLMLAQVIHIIEECVPERERRIEIGSRFKLLMERSGIRGHE